MLHSIWQDVKYGLRQMVRNPQFTLVAAASLALGIGANTAIFQLVNAIRLQSLPVRNPWELVSVDFAKRSSLGGNWSSRSARMTSTQLEQIRQQQQGFTGVFAWSANRFNLTNGGEPRFAEGLFVSGNFFDQLGVSTILGRTFGESEDTASTCGGGAVLSYNFWQREYGSDRGVIGRKMTLDGYPISIIGVTPPSFYGVEVGNRYDLAVPLCMDRLLAEDKIGRAPGRTQFWLSAMARLKPGWTAERASAQLKAVSPLMMNASLPPEYKTDQAKRYLKNKIEANAGATGVSGLRQDYEETLWVLMATTGLVLLIACANLANLLLARASVRHREIGVRLAIGASRWRLIRQLLIESLLLAVLGTAAGVAIAQLLSRGLVAFMTTEDNPLFIHMGTDWRVLGFTAGMALLTCMLFGLAPAFKATDVSPLTAMRASSRGMTAGRERFGLRRALMVAQVAFSLVLLVGAVLFVRSLRNLTTTDAGFKPDGILIVNIDFSKSNFPKDQRYQLYRRLREQLAGQVGVTSVAQVGFTPVSGNGWNNDIGPDGTVAASSGKESFFNRVGAGYFATMGTTVIAGREFTDADTVNAPKVAIVNKEFARKFFGGKNPVGHTFHMEQAAGKAEPLMQIVGLVENTKYYYLGEDPRPIGFFPSIQDEDPGPGASFVVRTSGSPALISNGAKNAIAAISPSIAVSFHSFSQQLAESLMRARLMALLSLAFGILAAVLATVGLYGVIAYLVTRRRNEIGIRIALGADRGGVILLVLREAMFLLIVGLAVGAGLSLWAGRAATTLLYGLKPYDPVSMVAAALLLASIAMAASYVPARRAAALQPMDALRDE